MLIFTTKPHPSALALTRDRRRQSFAPLGSHFHKVYLLPLELIDGTLPWGEFIGKPHHGESLYMVASDDGRWFERYFVRRDKIQKDLAFLATMRAVSVDHWEIVNAPSANVAA